MRTPRDSSISLTVMEMRWRSGVTQEHLAEALGISQPRLSEIERGQVRTTIDQGARILGALHSNEATAGLRPIESALDRGLDTSCHVCMQQVERMNSHCYSCVSP